MAAPTLGGEPMMRTNGWWRSRRGLAMCVLALSLTACMQPQVAAVPMMTPTPAASPAPTPAPATPSTVTGSATPAASPDGQGFADPAFRAVWERSDAPVASGEVSRSWLWGTPVPFGTLREPYEQATGGTRLVQYFDKGRMEINDSKADPASPWFVTSGLLTVELVTGQVQVGDGQFQDLEPAELPVVGDLEHINQQTPHYADFSGDRLTPAMDRTGQEVDTAFYQGGGEAQITPPAPVTIAAYDATTGHNIPDVFIAYFDQDLAAMGQEWLYVMGHPISEPYWVIGRIGGQTQVVLVQLFERRTLTYNPHNPPEWQVEFGNIGLDYYRWRYHD